VAPAHTTRGAAAGEVGQPSSRSPESPAKVATDLVKTVSGDGVRVWKQVYSHRWASPTSTTWSPGRRLAPDDWRVSVVVRSRDSRHERRAQWDVRLPLEKLVTDGTEIGFEDGDGTVVPAGAQAKRFQGIPHVPAEEHRSLSLLAAVSGLGSRPHTLDSFVVTPSFDDPGAYVQFPRSTMSLLRGWSWTHRRKITGKGRDLAVDSRTVVHELGSSRRLSMQEFEQRVAAAGILNVIAKWPAPPRNERDLSSAPMSDLTVLPRAK
jgi:hypothetical protein